MDRVAAGPGDAGRLGAGHRHRCHRPDLPLHLGPEHAFDTAEFSILLLVSTGVGIVAGEYLLALLADRFGRKRMLLAYLIIPGALLPVLLLERFGIDQRPESLEAVSGV